LVKSRSELSSSGDNEVDPHTKGLLMSSQTSLTAELQEFARNIPESAAERMRVSFSELTAAGVAPGLAIGDRAPLFTLPNAIGEPVKLAQRLEQGPVVLSFYRGDWCPICNIELRALQAALPRFQARGASLMAISPQSPDHSLSMTEKHDLAFDVLSDAEQDVIRSYRLHYRVPADIEDLMRHGQRPKDLSTLTANGTWELPIPATYVIDRTGIIRGRHVSPDYTTRMDPDEIDEALAALSRSEAVSRS
jgi:peroxiredoxin